MPKSKEVYVYEDLDHSDVQVFSTWKKAEDYRNKAWGDTPEWEECETDYGTSWHDYVSDYVTIHKREIQ